MCVVIGTLRSSSETSWSSAKRMMNHYRCTYSERFKDRQVLLYETQDRKFYNEVPNGLRYCK